MQQEYRKIWGRKHSRPLKDYQKGLLENLLPTLQLHLQQNSSFVLRDLFSQSYTDYCLEIGFGGGEHLAARASEFPNKGFIGCEPFINGVASLLKYIDQQKINNIRLVVDDARLLLKSLPDGCLSRIYIMFPDPWHKKRHHKRRIVSSETIADLSRVLKVGGELYLATDILDYAEWMKETLKPRIEFDLIMDGRKNLTDRPTDWPHTKYEQKGIKAGRNASYMIYRKNQ